jgi:uncharacterized protein with HEPN domain
VTRRREFLDYVADIEEAARHIDQFLAHMTWAQFVQDQKTIYAVVRAFEIIGEAAKKVPLSVRKRHPKVPWKQMAGMRDKLIMSISESIIRCCGRQPKKISPPCSLSSQRCTRKNRRKPAANKKDSRPQRLRHRAGRLQAWGTRRTVSVIARFCIVHAA